MDKEKFYDERIAPALMNIAKECEDNGLSFIALCEWDSDGRGVARTIQKGSSFALRMADTAILAQGNIDSFMMAVERYAKENGHNSIYLKHLGIKTDPDRRHIGE